MRACRHRAVMASLLTSSTEPDETCDFSLPLMLSFERMEPLTDAARAAIGGELANCLEMSIR